MADINSKISKGMLGTKLGMTQVWNESGKLVPVTVIELAPNVVTQVRTPERDGYNAVQIAYGQPARVAGRFGRRVRRSGLVVS
jgi:large subunit ribosomal protein L3